MIVVSQETQDQRLSNAPEIIEKRRAISEMWSLKEHHDPEKYWNFIIEIINIFEFGKIKKSEMLIISIIKFQDFLKISNLDFFRFEKFSIWDFSSKK